ncbi:MAG: response regulator transcription factor [Acidimicrobiales bacterium]
MRLLLIEDDPEITRVVSRGLEAEGFSVDVADNGADGLWRATEAEFDAVILDLLMPGMSGYQVCESLRRDGNRVPVVVLTAKDGEFDQIDLLDLGADDFLTKPVSIRLLAARVRASIRRASGASTNELTHGSIRFDLAGHRCWHDGEEVALTKKEADVLYVLVSAGGGAVTRAEIVRSAWGFDFDGDPGSVDVYINRLRKKLGGDAIKNIRGVGFQLRSE